MSSTQQKQQEPQLTNRKNSKISVGTNKSPEQSPKKVNRNQLMDKQVEQQAQNNDVKDDVSLDNQSELGVEEKTLDKKQKLSLQEQERRKLGEEVFLQKKHKLEILLQSLMLNQHRCFPYKTRYTPFKKGIFDDDINEETQKEEENEAQQNEQRNQKSAINDQNETKEVEAMKKPRETSLRTCIEQIQAKIRQVQMGNNMDQEQDEFLDQVW